MTEQPKNKAIEIMDGEAPFLQPMPSDDEALIRTIADFALEITPLQNHRLTQLQMLALEPKLRAGEKEKILLFIALFERRKRYHDAKFFIGDALQSLSWRKFVMQGQMEGKVNKTNMGG